MRLEAELGQGQEDHGWFSHGSTCTTSVFPKYTDDVWFLEQAIWREEHQSEYDLKKPVEGSEDLECRDHTVILYKGLSNQRTTWSGKIRSGEYKSGDNHLEWPPRFIHLRNACQKEVITFSRLWEECTQEEDWLIIKEENIGETKYQDLMIQRRSLKWWGIWRTQLLKNLLSILSIWIRNDEVMNEEYDKAEGSRRSLPTKQIKISIQLSFHDIVFAMQFVYIQLIYYAW